MSDVEDALARPGGVSYLRIPAPDPAAAARFYGHVFGWQVDLDRDEPSFSDGGGYVIGHFVAHQRPAGEDGIRPYVYVDDVAATLARATAGGAEILEEPYPEGSLTVATFRDPAGNVVGVWRG